MSCRLSGQVAHSHACLQAHFQSEACVDAKCSVCKQAGGRVRQVLLLRPPPVLVLFFKRFKQQQDMFFLPQRCGVEGLHTAKAGAYFLVEEPTPGVKNAFASAYNPDAHVPCMAAHRFKSQKPELISKS